MWQKKTILKRAAKTYLYNRNTYDQVTKYSCKNTKYRYNIDYGIKASSKTFCLNASFGMVTILRGFSLLYQRQLFRIIMDIRCFPRQNLTFFYRHTVIKQNSNRIWDILLSNSWVFAIASQRKWNYFFGSKTRIFFQTNAINTGKLS